MIHLLFIFIHLFSIGSAIDVNSLHSQSNVAKFNNNKKSNNNPPQSLLQENQQDKAQFIDAISSAASSAASSGILSTLVDGLLHAKHQYFFHSPNTQIEELPEGEMTMDGGEYDSASQKDCAIEAGRNNGVCSLPCATHWPNGACIIKDANDACICVDPCTAFDKPAYGTFKIEELRFNNCVHLSVVCRVTIIFTCSFLLLCCSLSKYLSSLTLFSLYYNQMILVTNLYYLDVNIAFVINLEVI